MVVAAGPGLGGFPPVPPLPPVPDMVGGFVEEDDVDGVGAGLGLGVDPEGGFPDPDEEGFGVDVEDEATGVCGVRGVAVVGARPRAGVEPVVVR